MRRRRYFVGLAALLVAASMILIAAPAGATGFGAATVGSDDCVNSMNPANNGNTSGLYIACVFSSAAQAGTSLTIDDYKDAVWHAGAVRQVTATVSRANGSEAGHYVVKFAGGAAAELGPQASDVNHSIENLTSTVYTINQTSPLGAFIDAGTTIRAVVPGAANIGYWVLSKPTVAGRNGSPACSTGTTCNKSVGITLSISNNVGREGNNGATTANSAVVTSAQSNPTGCTGTDPADCSGAGTGNTSADQGMHFDATDAGNFISGGDLPDGAQIATVTNANSVTLDCNPTASVGGAPVWNWGDGSPCVSPFVGTVTTASGLVTTITPYPIPTSVRFISGATLSGSKGGVPERTITTTSPVFSKFDIGLLVRGCDTSSAPGSVCASPTVVAAGARIASVGNGGTTAVLDPVSGSSTSWTVGTAQHLTIGIQSKTAPSTGDVVGSLAIGLIVDPNISPTSPPCAANKVSGFQLPIKWRNPGPSSGAGYDFGFSGPPINQYAGASISGTSTAQLTIITSVTTFAGFLRQNLTVASTVPTTTRWQVAFESLPVGIGLCTGTGISETLEIKGLSNKHAVNPSGTGGAFGATRALLPEAQNQAGGTTYTGSAVSNTVGAHVTAGGAHTETNACTVTSPNIIGIGCQ